jgi:GT2 family glycosyltransferase
MLPKVSVVWLNYNSAHIIAVTKQSLDSLFHLDYPNLELIVVDNNSSDGSREVIEECLNKVPENIHLKFLKRSENDGWIGGINAGYYARDRQSTYLALTHNDIIAEQVYLKNAVSFLEKNQDIGALQGIVTKMDSAIIDSSGFMADDALELKSIYNGISVSDFQSESFVSVVEAAMPIYRVEAVKHTLNDDHLFFIPEGFMYYLEDVFVSFKLWENGYKCIVLPFIAGSHYRMGVIQKSLKPSVSFYYLLRNRIAMLVMTNSGSTFRVLTQQIRKLTISNRSIEERKLIFQALRNGLSLGKKIRKKYGAIDLSLVPIQSTTMKSKILKWLH